MTLDALLEQGKYCDAALVVAYFNNRLGSLDSLVEAFEKYHDTENQNIRNIIGTAHLLMLELDNANDYLEDKENLKQVALWYGRFPQLAKQLANEEEFAQFLKEKAIPHAPMYDDGLDYYLDEEALDFIYSELEGRNPEELIEKTVEKMIDMGNQNIPKQVLLAALIDNPFLSEPLKEKFYKIRRRDDLATTLQEYCLVRDWKYLKEVQTGNKNGFFPTASHVFLIENNGKKEIIKEHIRLYVDFDKLDGYNKEKEICERIRHPNFVDHLGSFTTNGREFLRFAFFEGDELTKYIREDNLLPEDEAIKIVHDLAELIDYFHKNNILYMDIKAKNVLYNRKQIKLIDTGMSQIMDAPVDENTRARSLLSTPMYMPPEWGTTFTVQNTSETFQLGILFYQLLTGKHPFAHHDFIEGDLYRESEIIRYGLPNIFNEYETPEQLNPELDKLIRNMLNKDPIKRPAPGQVAEYLAPKEVAV